jgi:hypothetical protein
MPETHRLYAEASEMVRTIYKEFQRIEVEHNYTITLASKCKVITHRDSKYRPYDVTIYFSKGNGHHLSCLDWMFNKPKSSAHPISRRMATYLHKNCKYGGIHGLLMHLPFIEDVLHNKLDTPPVEEPLGTTLVSLVEEPVPAVTASTWSPLRVTMYDVYECLRNQLSTTAAYEPLYINGEAALPSSLVMMLEDGDATLAARFEAERRPQPKAPAITKKATKYDRKAIVKLAHRHAKALGDGEYSKRFGSGMRAAWKAAKEAVVTNATYQSVYMYMNYVSVDELKMVKRMLSKPSTVNFNYRSY